MNIKEIKRQAWLKTYGKKTYTFNFICLCGLVTLFLLKAISFDLLVFGSIYCGNKMIERSTR